MSRPKAYDPQQGYMFQLLVWDNYNRRYDHLDYARDRNDKNYLLEEYRLIYGTGLKTIQLPKKFWKEIV